MMLSEISSKFLKSTELSSKILWFGMSWTILVLVGMSYLFVGNSALYTNQSFSPNFAQALPVLSALFALLSVVLAKKLFSADSLKKHFGRSWDNDTISSLYKTRSKRGSLVAEKLAEIPINERPYVLISFWYNWRMILVLALNEVIVILGFIHVFLSKESSIILPYALVSFILSFSVFPNYRKFLEHIRF